MVARFLFVMLVAPASRVAAVLRGSSVAFLATDAGEHMRPDVVANALVDVEEEWRQLAADFSEGNSTAQREGAPTSFAKSCGTVVAAVIQGSGGDRTVANEYMSTVCRQKVLEGWHKLRCTALATAITENAMLADNYANRQMLNPAKVCGGFWSVFVEQEKKREEDEAKIRAEQEKQREEDEKKAAEAAAEAQKKAEEEARAEAERRAKEEEERQKQEQEEAAKHEAENAQVRAEEAKKRAAESAARLAEKKAEAEKVQKEAQEKLEEAAKAEEEHNARLAEHEKAEEMLHNASSAEVSNVTEVSSSINASVDEAAEKVNVSVTPAPVVETNATKEGESQEAASGNATAKF